MTRWLPIPLVLSLALFTACDEDDPTALPTGCDAPHGCEIEGVDVAILAAEIDFAGDQHFRSEVDAHVVAPGDEVDVRVRVVNRGTEPAPATRLVVYAEPYDSLADVAIPDLDPGEERTIRVDVTVPELRMWPRMLYPLYVFIGTDSTAFFDDADVDNNYTPEDAELFFHPLVPILDVELLLPDTIRGLHPYILSGTVRNHSPFVASADLPFGMCIYPGNPVCLDEPDGPLTSTGIVTANGSRIVPVGLTAPLEWGVDVNHPDSEVALAACFPDSAGWESGITCVDTWYERVLVPNLEALCTPPALIPTTTFMSRDPEAQCDLWADGTETGAQHFLWRLEVEEGDVFRFTAQDSTETFIHFFDVEARWLDPSVILRTAYPSGEFTAPESGALYVMTGRPFGPASAPVLIEQL